MALAKYFEDNLEISLERKRDWILPRKSQTAPISNTKYEGKKNKNISLSNCKDNRIA